MTTITIRNVEPAVRNELAARAAKRGQSLQEYLLGEVTRLAARPPMAEVLAAARLRVERSGVTVPPEDILADRSADRR
ncbi:FitA-like ribbon-helix-helix domain-containing protein [Microlunatus sp. Y2014]|uniref:FitA-like ribbon-helix-helix domain-containing protein n=1 Tax=Microlunatus sp. Y2014 TaxID=3418488 RepID=UPI003DA7263E